MGKFKDFKNNIAELGGVWNDKNNIYFSQMRDSYAAEYRPHSPRSSTKDIIIQTIEKTGAYLRGNYELIIFLENKFTALYFDDVDDIKNFLEGVKQ